MLRSRFGHLLLVGLVLAAGCSRSGDRAAETPDEVTTAAGAGDRASLVGAGSTFAAPIVEEWIRQYRRVAPGVSVGYQPIGSLHGTERLASGSVDFAVSELPLADAFAGAAQAGFPAIEVPFIAGGIAIAYNLPGVSSLNLSLETLAAIFAGKVTRWDDPTITADNRGQALPATELRVVRRSDPSGTTQVLTQALTAGAPEMWTAGAGPTVTWPTGAAAEGSQAVIAALQETVGAIGYVQASYALRAALPSAAIRNSAGNFVSPTATGVNAAVSRANPEAPGAYPLATISFLVLSEPGPGPPESGALRHFVAWTLTEGQRSAERLGYVRVPDPFLTKALATVLESGQQATGRTRGP